MWSSQSLRMAARKSLRSISADRAAPATENARIRSPKVRSIRSRFDIKPPSADTEWSRPAEVTVFSRIRTKKLPPGVARSTLYWRRVEIDEGTKARSGSQERGSDRRPAGGPRPGGGNG